jgi:xanthine/uracil permease
MKTKAYTVFGFLAWEGIKLVVRRKLAQKRATLLAGATVLLVALAGFVAARSGSSDDE